LRESQTEKLNYKQHEEGGSSMDTKLAEVTVHIDESTSHDEREKFRDVLLAMDGVIAARMVQIFERTV
jgi:hypothetical protein